MVCGNTKPESWQEIAAKASTEHDGEKLMALVKRLCQVFETMDNDPLHRIASQE